MRVAVPSRCRWPIIIILIILIIWNLRYLSKYAGTYIADIELAMKQHTSTRVIYVPTPESRFVYEEMRNAAVNDTNSTAGRLVYRGTSGLGHRLSRMSAAFHLAKVTNTSHLWASWGWECGPNENGDPDIFDHLFGRGPMIVQTLPENQISAWHTLEVPTIPKQYTTTGFPLGSIRIVNDVKGYGKVWGGPRKMRGMKKKDISSLILEKKRSDVEFFRQLRALFRFNGRAQSFVEKHKFSERVVVGLHLRAGNGEKGDFQEKSRGVEHMETWLNNTTNLLSELIDKVRGTHNDETKRKSIRTPLVFLATDTPSLVSNFSDACKPYGISVVTYPQQIMEEGTGVSFYHKWNGTSACYEDWVGQFMDATLLSVADIVVAGQYSSFSQTLPLTTLLSESIMASAPSVHNSSANQSSDLGVHYNDDERFARKLFCEVSKEGDAMGCFDDYQDWMFRKNAIVIGDNDSFQKKSNYHTKEVQMPGYSGN